MIGRACVVRSLTTLFLLSIATTAAPQSAWAKKLTLPQLLDMARGNPGLQANAAAISASEAQVTEAKTNWLPQGDLLSILAPSPNIKCSMGVENCVETTSPEARITDVSWNKVFTRTEVKLIQPIFDFGKISAGVGAAEGGGGGGGPEEGGGRAGHSRGEGRGG